MGTEESVWSNLNLLGLASMLHSHTKLRKTPFQKTIEHRPSVKYMWLKFGSNGMEKKNVFGKIRGKRVK